MVRWVVCGISNDADASAHIKCVWVVLVMEVVYAHLYRRSGGQGVDPMARVWGPTRDPIRENSLFG